MRKEDKREQVENLKSDAESAKMRLVSIESQLREIGALREANSLSTIIGKLELWQNK